MYPQMNQPGQVFTYKCGNCGSPLQNLANQEFVTCQYCGSTNQLPHQAMTSTIGFEGVQINARTDMESLLRSAEFAINCRQFDKAKEVLFSAVMSGSNDYRVYISKLKVDLLDEEDSVTFEDLAKLQEYERSEQNKGGDVTRAICAMMHYRGKNGVTLLHCATYQARYDLVVYCVEHQADVNLIFGAKQLTPISIMFLPDNPRYQNPNGSLNLAYRDVIKAIRNYLMAHGAVDVKRKGF